jgi:hypothetical protein
MPNLEFATGTVVLPVWAVGAAVTLFVCIGVLTLTRTGARLAGSLLRVAGVIVAFATMWYWFNQTSLHERAAERRALDQRISDLNSRAISPGSGLACLDAGAGDTVETACEKAVFATPQSVAEAVSYVSARLALLADATDFARRTGGNYESGIAPLRLAIETDRYGLVAHVLSVRDSCTPLLCDSYVLLHDPDRVQANLRERLFDRYVDRYAAKWAAQTQAASPPVAENPSPYATASVPPATPAPPTAAPVPSKYDFPSAASIPPVSIMNAEPGTPPQPKSDAKAEAWPDNKSESKPAARPQHPPPARATAAARPTPAAPQSIAPPATGAPGAALR